VHDLDLQFLGMGSRHHRRSRSAGQKSLEYLPLHDILPVF
jgi:hypothetical protein